MDIPNEIIQFRNNCLLSHNDHTTAVLVFLFVTLFFGKYYCHNSFRNRFVLSLRMKAIFPELYSGTETYSVNIVKRKSKEKSELSQKGGGAMFSLTKVGPTPSDMPLSSCYNSIQRVLMNSQNIMIVICDPLCKNLAFRVIIFRYACI